MDKEDLGIILNKLMGSISFCEDGDLDSRIESVKNSIGILEQMKKLPSGCPKAHKIYIIRAIVRDCFGIKGEPLTL